MLQVSNDIVPNRHALRHPTSALHCSEMAAYAKALDQHAFDKIWVPDHLTYENVFVILAAIIAGTGAQSAPL
jgi:alkanesulfonate monooxygenase SsuD/methylene tetrahydromethanopterin reductase-like flavin-dependent oxidoreductase (luciferase family)